ncbi:MAG: hypothetical protein M3R15_10860 [Acidobacteriota bacterium]|nr:hypothetical protein [Acidobacteriota bacterium]
MSGYAICTGTCYGCKQLFTFNPLYVPSLTIDGVRWAFCRACIERANAIRKDKGMPPLEVHPRGYEPLPEEELP